MRLDEDIASISMDRTRSDVAPASFTREREKENSAGLNRQRGRAESDSVAGGVGGKTEEGDFGDTFLNFVGMTSWTPPWSTTRVSVQESNGLKENGVRENTLAAQGQGKKLGKETEKQQQGQSGAPGDSWRKRGARDVFAPSSPDAAAKGVKGAGPGDVEPQLCVLDARTAVAAMGNQLVGKGVETGAG